MQKSLKNIVKKINKKYDGLINDDFTLGVDKRIVPVMVDDVVTGWKIQQLVGDVWVDLCNEVFNTMEELISRNKIENANRFLDVNENEKEKTTCK